MRLSVAVETQGQRVIAACALRESRNGENEFFMDGRETSRQRLDLYSFPIHPGITDRRYIGLCQHNYWVLSVVSPVTERPIFMAVMSVALASALTEVIHAVSV